MPSERYTRRWQVLRLQYDRAVRTTADAQYQYHRKQNNPTTSPIESDSTSVAPRNNIMTKHQHVHKVLSYFAEGWRETAMFESTVDVEHETLREITCCLNSEQCDLSKNRQEAVDCSGYITETSNERALLGAELFVVSMCK